LWEKNVLEAIAPYDPKQDAHFYVIDRRKGRGLVAVYKAPAFFAFHTINAGGANNFTTATSLAFELDELVPEGEHLRPRAIASGIHRAHV